ncbi:MAG: SAM-dependent methyltransferase [Microgenomates group bacterium GW2011_GWC2_45_8]|nr:MAG: SAM-dependent methyltransferase [Microgenomates group bacterium GW2011_GWC2_45_8]
MKDLIAKIKMYGVLKSFNFFLSEAKYKLRQLSFSSYSQREEDLVIDRLLKYKKRGFYVDIGANDPHRFSNTKRFYLKGWRGINIDPNMDSIERFMNSRPKDINLNIGISGEKSKIIFFRFFPDTLSTFSPNLAKDYVKSGYKKIKEEYIQTFPLAMVLKKYAGKKKIDFLSVDTEGFDEKVLKSNDWKKYKPKIICVESNKSGESKINNLLRENKYTLAFDNGLNSIYEAQN